MKKRTPLFYLLPMFALAGITSSLERSEENHAKEVILTTDAPMAIGPYSQAIRVGEMLFCSGQIPIDPKTSALVRGTIESVTVFLADMDNFDRMNNVYVEYFKTLPPARSAVEVTRLPKDVSIEIALIAIVT